MIYFIEAEGLGRVKIGYTASTEGIETRVRQIATGCPAKPIVRALIEGTIAQERKIHSAFFLARVHGEWFRLTPRIERLIADLQAADSAAQWALVVEAMAEADAHFESCRSEADRHVAEVRAALSDAITRYIEKHGVAAVSQVTGKDATSVRGWRRGRALMSYDSYIAMTRHDPDCFAAVTSLKGRSSPLREAEAPTVADRLERIERELEAIRQEAA